MVMARLTATQRLLHLSLLGVLLFYLTVPYWGTAWHSVVPEHEHWSLGAGAQDSVPDEDTLCVRCVTTPSPETVVHAFNPVSAMQFLSVMVGLVLLLSLHRPDGLSTRLLPATLYLTSPLLVPLDPPPVL